MSGRVKRHVRRAMGNGGILIRSNGRAADGNQLGIGLPQLGLQSKVLHFSLRRLGQPCENLMERSQQMFDGRRTGSF